MIWLGVALATARPTPAPEASAGASPAVREAYEKAASSLLCYCGCARQTVKDCTCGVAFDLRDQFEAALAKGASSESIIDTYIAAHGEQSRTVPPKKGLNLLAWFGPGAAILLAAAGTIVAILVWSARGRKALPLPAPAAGAEEMDALHKRMEEELERFDA